MNYLPEGIDTSTLGILKIPKKKAFAFLVPDTSNIQKKPIDLIFPQRIHNMKSHVCTTCYELIEGFDDVVSQKEFLISGMCQKCQDDIFDEEHTQS